MRWRPIAEADVRKFTVVTVAAVLSLAIGAGAASARYYGHGGHGGWHGGWYGWHGGWYGGTYLGVGPWWWGYPYGYAYPYPYYPNPYAYPYGYAYPYPSISPAPPAPTAPPPDVWYYCPSRKAYYPYVSSCPEAWQTVPTRPPQSGR